MGGMLAGNAVTSGLTREKPSARLMEVGSSGAISDDLSIWTRTPVAVLLSATEAVLSGPGRRRRLGSIASHGAVSGPRTPGSRSGTSKPEGGGGAALEEQ